MSEIVHQLAQRAVHRTKQSRVWGWLNPAANPRLMPVTYLKGAGAVIGRDVEAFQALHAANPAGRYHICRHVVHNLLHYTCCCIPSKVMHVCPLV